jgi:hypothetical protein
MGGPIPHRYINIDVGKETAQFLFWGHINGIFGTVYSVEYTEDFYTDKTENIISSYIRKSRRERLQSHI